MPHMRYALVVMIIVASGSVFAQAVTPEIPPGAPAVFTALGQCTAGVDGYERRRSGRTYTCDGSRGVWVQDRVNTVFSAPNIGGQGPDTGVAFNFFPPGNPDCGLCLIWTGAITVPGTCSGACAALPEAQRIARLAVRLSNGFDLCTLDVPCAAAAGSTLLALCTNGVGPPLLSAQFLYTAPDTACTKNPAVGTILTCDVIACAGT